jgi:predicted DNA-binding protein (UPF0251 family)
LVRRPRYNSEAAARYERAIASNQSPEGTEQMADIEDTEEWRYVEGWPDYEVSSQGRVRRRVPRYFINPKNGQTKIQYPAGRFSAIWLDKDGYPRVGLSKNGKQNQFTVSVLVCVAFHGPRPSKRHQAAHNNGNRSQNTPQNLRWALPVENSADMVKHGKSQRGEKHHKAILSALDVMAIRLLLAQNIGPAEIAHTYGVTKHTIWRIKSRQNWGWL